MRCIIWGESCHFFFLGKRKHLSQSLFQHPMIRENLQIHTAVSWSELRGEDPEGERGRPWRRVGKPWRREGKTLEDAQEESGARAEEWGCTQLQGPPSGDKMSTSWQTLPTCPNKRFQQTPTEDLTELSMADIHSNMDEPWDHHSQWSKSDRGEISYDIPYIQDLKRNYTIELTYKTQKRPTDLENKLTWGEEWGEGIVREFGVKRYTLSYLKWLPNKDSLYSAGNSAQCYVAARKGRKFGREWTRICVAESLCYSPETHNIVCLSPIPQYKIKSFFFNFSIWELMGSDSTVLLYLSCWSRTNC